MIGVFNDFTRVLGEPVNFPPPPVVEEELPPQENTFIIENKPEAVVNSSTVRVTTSRLSDEAVTAVSPESSSVKEMNSAGSNFAWVG